MRHNEGQGKVQHAPDIVRASTTEPISALRSTIGSLWSAGCAWPRDRLNPDAASRSVVDFDPRLVADAAECLSLGLQTRRARPKSFLRRPPRARKRPSEPSCCSSRRRVKRLCGIVCCACRGEGVRGFASSPNSASTLHPFLQLHPSGSACAWSDGHVAAPRGRARLAHTALFRTTMRYLDGYSWHTE